MLLLAAGVTALAVVAGCGRKGPLEPPPGSVSQPQSESDAPASNENDRRIILDNLI